MKKMYTGSCHCGKVRFEVDLDLSAGTVKCNCTICLKLRSWLAAVSPDALRLVSGKSELSDYQFGPRRIHHLFCRSCGIRPFGHANIPEAGGEFYAVNLAVLDNIDPTELANAPVQYVDGRNDNWQSPPAETRHL